MTVPTTAVSTAPSQQLLFGSYHHHEYSAFLMNFSEATATSSKYYRSCFQIPTSRDVNQGRTLFSKIKYQSFVQEDELK